ncbi:hypothetical protein [Nocardia sp. NPDC051750]|uniref:hypothetical protein n=1 Tax=Nocardia sp. NPDC051750 TaxID=3364325 RepID=UPI003790F8A1
MTKLFVLDIDDFRPLAEVAAKDADVTVRRRGPYLEIVATGSIRIERNVTGCRNALWYSAVAAVQDGRIRQWDKSELVVEPTGAEG